MTAAVTKIFISPNRNTAVAAIGLAIKGMVWQRYFQYALWHMETLPGYLTGFLALLLFTAFVKIVTTLSILRFGLGLQGSGFGLVILGFSLGLSLLVMGPQLEPIGGAEPLLRGQVPQERQALEKTFRPFMEKNCDPALKAELNNLASKLRSGGDLPKPPVEGGSAPATAAATPLTVLVPAFLISELRDAFQIGFLILVPFLVLDLLLANLLLALGVTQIPLQIVALPLKILLFFAVDGWRLIAEKVIGTYF